MWFGDYKPNPKGPLNDIHKKEKTMVSQNRNLSQKLVVEERHTREYFTGNVTAEGLINAEIDTDYGARPLTPSQARFALKTWPTAPTRRTRNNKSCRSGSFFIHLSTTGK